MILITFCSIFQLFICLVVNSFVFYLLNMPYLNLHHQSYLYIIFLSQCFSFLSCVYHIHKNNTQNNRTMSILVWNLTNGKNYSRIHQFHQFHWFWWMLKSSKTKIAQGLTATNLPFLMGIHSMQGWPSTTSHGVKPKKSTKRFKHTGNLFRKNLQLKGVC